MDALATYQASFTDVKQSAAPPINGQGRPAFERLTKSQRVALAVAVMRGEANLRPTLKVVARALEVSATYIEQAARLSPEQLRQVRRGELTLAELKPAPDAPKPATTLADVVAWWLTASEAEHAAVVGSVGVRSLTGRCPAQMRGGAVLFRWSNDDDHTTSRQGEALPKRQPRCAEGREWPWAPTPEADHRAARASGR
jgi:hypothetical protein